MSTQFFFTITYFVHKRGFHVNPTLDLFSSWPLRVDSISFENESLTTNLTLHKSNCTYIRTKSTRKGKKLGYQKEPKISKNFCCSVGWLGITDQACRLKQTLTFWVNVAFWGYYQRNPISNYLTRIEPRQYYNLFRFQSSVRLGSSSNSK